MQLIGIKKTTEFPCLHGPSVKAASTRALVPWAAEVSALVLDGSSYRRRRHRMIMHLLQFQQTVQRAGMFFKPEELVAVRSSIRDHLVCYQWLSIQACENY